MGSESGGAKGIERPEVEDTSVGKEFLQLMGKADKRTQELFNLMQPSLKMASGQAMNMLEGGPGPFAPAIQSALGQAQGALSQSLDSSKENWSRMGITGSDYAQLAANMERQGGQQIAGIPSAMMQPMLTAIFQSLTGAPGLAIQSQQGTLGAAGQVTGAAIQPATGQTIAQDVGQWVKNVGDTASIVGKIGMS